MRWLLKIAGSLAFLWLLSGMAGLASAAEYEVHGEIDQTWLKDDGSIQFKVMNTFAVFVKDCSWLVQTIEHNETGTPISSFETSCTNGSEVYEVGEPENPP